MKLNLFEYTGDTYLHFKYKYIILIYDEFYIHKNITLEM